MAAGVPWDWFATRVAGLSVWASWRNWRVHKPVQRAPLSAGATDALLESM